MNHRTVPPEVARFALILGAALSACDAANARSLHGALTSLGVEDAPAKPPVSFQVLCDRSVGSPCEHGLAMQTIERVLREAVTRPLSRVEVYAQGDEVAETRLIASVTIPTRVDRGERAARAAEERFLQSVRPVLCMPLGAELTRARTRHSVIFESGQDGPDPQRGAARRGVRDQRPARGVGHRRLRVRPAPGARAARDAPPPPQRPRAEHLRPGPRPLRRGRWRPRRAPRLRRHDGPRPRDAVALPERAHRRGRCRGHLPHGGSRRGGVLAARSVAASAAGRAR